jgi:WD40 repeat protein
MDLRTGRVRTASGRHNAPVGPQIVFTRNGRRVITSGRDGSVIVWNVARAAVEEEFTGHGGAVRGLAVSTDGGTLYSAGADGRVIVWDLTGRRRLGRPFRIGAAGQPGFPRWALSGDDRLLAFGGEDGQVTFVDARTFRRLRTVRLIHGRGALDAVGDRVRAILGMRFLPGRHLIAVGSFGGVLAITDADSGRILHRLRGHVKAIFTPGIDAKGTVMVTGSDDQSIRWWSLPDGRPLGQVLRISTAPSDVQLSPDGRWVTIIDGSNTLQLADARTHRVVRRVRGPDGLFFARFSPDGRFVAVGDVHGRAEVWSTATWRPVTRPLSGHTGKVSQAEISRDDRTLATGSTDGTVRLWDIASEQPIGAALPGLAEQEVIPIFTPDNRGLIAAYNNGRGFRWDIDPLTLQRQACRVAGRRLTRAEWEEFLPGRPYQPAC